MSTIGSRPQSLIALYDGRKFRSIYCHYDGYPEHNGRILAEHYAEPKKVEELIDLGNISTLAEEIGRRHSPEESGQHPTWCIAYHRDHGKDAGMNEASSNSNFFGLLFRAYASMAEFLYIFNGRGWEQYNITVLLDKIEDFRI